MNTANTCEFTRNLSVIVEQERLLVEDAVQDHLHGGGIFGVKIMPGDGFQMNETRASSIVQVVFER